MATEQVRREQDADANSRAVPSTRAFVHDTELAATVAQSRRQTHPLATSSFIDSSARMVAQRRQSSALFDDAGTAARANRTGLPDNLKTGIESLSGMSLDAVRVHYNSSRPAQLGAHAYARGSDIHVGPGQERHLPHEAWHVVQQAQGRVAPTMHSADGTPINDDTRLEREADAMGTRALQRVADPRAARGHALAAASGEGAAVQRMGEEWIAPIVEGLGIAASTAVQFVQYLLATYPVTTIVAMLASSALLTFAYSQFHGATVQDKAPGPGSAPKTTPKTAPKPTPPAKNTAGTPPGGKLAPPPGKLEKPVKKAKIVTDDTNDFHWFAGKARRDPGIEMTPHRTKAWQAFCEAGPLKKKSKKPKPKTNWNDEVFKSRQREKEEIAASVPDSPAYEPFVAVPLPFSTPFFVNIERRAYGDKSSSLGGKKGTKPLAVVYGYFGGASRHDDATEPAEVHVHFNDGKDIDTHTGAHVKMADGSYLYDWPPGTASAQAALARILTEGFHGDGWKRIDAYL